MRHIQFKLRRLMAVIGLVAIVLAGGEQARRYFWPRTPPLPPPPEWPWSVSTSSMWNDTYVNMEGAQEGIHPYRSLRIPRAPFARKPSGPPPPFDQILNATVEILMEMNRQGLAPKALLPEWPWFPTGFEGNYKTLDYMSITFENMDDLKSGRAYWILWVPLVPWEPPSPWHSSDPNAKVAGTSAMKEKRTFSKTESSLP